MLFLFGDESGDITVGKGKRYFIYVGVLARSKKECDEFLNNLITKEYEKSFNRKFRKEVHASNLEKEELEFFLGRLHALDYRIYYSHIDTYDKSKELNQEKDANLRKAKVLESVIVNSYILYPTIREIFIDKGGISEDVRKQLELDLERHFKKKFKIQAVASHKSAGVQIADIISWSIKEYLEGNDSLYEMIKERVSGRTEL